MGIACAEELLNVEEEKAIATTLGRKGIRGKRVQEETEIDTEEMERASSMMKSSEAIGMDGIAVEFLKKGGVCIVK